MGVVRCSWTSKWFLLYPKEGHVRLFRTASRSPQQCLQFPWKWRQRQCWWGQLPTASREPTSEARQTSRVSHIASGGCHLESWSALGIMMRVGQLTRSGYRGVSYTLHDSELLNEALNHLGQAIETLRMCVELTVKANCSSSSLPAGPTVSRQPSLRKLYIIRASSCAMLKAILVSSIANIRLRIQLTWLAAASTTPHRRCGSQPLCAKRQGGV